MKSLTVVHNQISIVYDEESNRWNFTLRGRDRQVQSLSSAKAMIDKPVPRDQATFKPIPVIYSHHSSDYRFATIVGDAGRGKWRDEQEVWLKTDQANRTKGSLEGCYADIKENRGLIEKIRGAQDQIAVLQNKIYGLKKAMTKATLPSEEIQ